MRGGVRRSQVECSVRTMPVEVADVDAEDVLELAATEDEQPVEAFPSHASDPPLRVSVRVRRPDRRADDADAFALEEAVEGAGELRITVVDQKPHSLAAVVAIHQQVARLLSHPRRIRTTRTGEILDPARPNRDEEEHVQPPQPDRLDGEEIASQHCLSVLAEKSAPGGPGPLRRWRDTGAREHVPHQRRRDADAQLAQFPDDPDVASVTVLPRQAQDQLAHLLIERRPAGPPMRVRPTAREHPAVPAQQRLRSDEERLPSATRQHPAERRQHQPVGGGELRPPRLPPQDRQVMPQDEDLELLRAVAARAARRARRAGKRRHRRTRRAQAASEGGIADATAHPSTELQYGSTGPEVLARDPHPHDDDLGNRVRRMTSAFSFRAKRVKSGDPERE